MLGVSVCMATFNGEKYIERQLKSILEQLDLNDELIVSDDDSSDQTLAIVESFQDPRIKIFPHAGLRKASANFNRAIEQSKGQIVVLADQDDEWLEGRMAFIKDKLDGKNKTLLFLDGHMVNEQGNTLQPSIHKYLKARKGVVQNFWRNTYMGCCLAFTADLKPIVLPIPYKVPMHDSWIGILAECYGEVVLESFKSLKYRVHGQNASLRGFGFKTKIVWRIVLLYELIKRTWKLYKGR